MSEEKALPPELTGALNARSEDDVVEGDGGAARVPLSQASGAAQVSAISRLVSVLGPDFKRLMASLLLVGFKLVELTPAEKEQVQKQMIEVAREAKAKAQADAKPNVLKMPARPRIIRPN